MGDKPAPAGAAFAILLFAPVQGDQYVMAQAQECGKTARVLQRTLNLFERRMEAPTNLDW
jgi:hypothetical protein